MYAKSKNLSIDDAANSIILGYISIVTPSLHEEEKKSSKASDFLSLKGILKSSVSKMSDKDMIDEYVKDKYGV